jgi:hypothetical protein
MEAHLYTVIFESKVGWNSALIADPDGDSYSYDGGG